jgi:hypothetical protein
MDQDFEQCVLLLYQSTLKSILNKTHFQRKDLMNEIYSVARILSIKDFKAMEEALKRIDEYFIETREKVFKRRLYGEGSSTGEIE